MTIIAPEQCSPTPSTVTFASPAPAIFPKIVSVLTAGSTDDPAANVCSKSLDQPPGVFGVPAVVLESDDSMMMYMASPATGALPPVGTAAMNEPPPPLP